MTEILSVLDLQEEMRDYHDFSVAMEVNRAIDEALRTKRIGEKDLLTVHVLGEIRGKLYELGKKSGDDAVFALMEMVISKNSNPTEGALQLIESRMRTAPR